MAQFFSVGDANALLLPDGRQYLARHTSSWDPGSADPAVALYPHYQLTIRQRSGFEATWSAPVSVGGEVVQTYSVGGPRYRTATGAILAADALLVAGPVALTGGYYTAAVVSHDGGATWPVATLDEWVHGPAAQIGACAWNLSRHRFAYRYVDNRAVWAAVSASYLYCNGVPALPSVPGIVRDEACDPAVCANLAGGWDVLFVADAELQHWHSDQVDGSAPWVMTHRASTTIQGLCGTQMLQLADGRLVAVGGVQVNASFRGRSGDLVAFIGVPSSSTAATWSGPITIGTAGSGYTGDLLSATPTYGLGSTDPYVLQLPDGSVEAGWVEGDGTVKAYRAADPAGTWTAV